MKPQIPKSYLVRKYIERNLYPRIKLLNRRGQLEMATYFDEHNCQELADGEGPDHLMHRARLLMDTGYWDQVIKYI